MFFHDVLVRSRRSLTLCVTCLLLFGILGRGSRSQADVVMDWNDTMIRAIQSDGLRPTNMANPGWSTRSMAMVNAAIYDVFQSIQRTHVPFLVDSPVAAPTSLAAAVHQAAYDVLRQAYPNESSVLDSDFNTRMGAIPASIEKTNGIALGQSIAQAYLTNRTGDNANVFVPYTPLPGPGFWRPDPWNPGQVAWGPGWGTVRPFAIPATTPFVNALPPIPALNSPEYTAAFHMVRDYGDLNSTVRTQDQTEIGLFWAYDRGGMGPPPVLYLRNLMEIATQAGNSVDDNSRLFAQASVAMADAAISAWDAKFRFNFWRPVGGIQEAGIGGPGDADGNPDTVGIPNWKPLGAPGANPGDDLDDFTPPFPSWVSGHATMGGALFQTIEDFYGTNSFDAIDGTIGNNPTYVLTSQEAGSGASRIFSTFTQTAPLGIGTEDSPEGENGTSRIYLGIHWIFDQQDGITLGNDIAAYVTANRFQPIPEPLAGPWIFGWLALAAWRRFR